MHASKCTFHSQIVGDEGAHVINLCLIYNFSGDEALHAMDVQRIHQVNQDEEAHAMTRYLTQELSQSG